MLTAISQTILNIKKLHFRVQHCSPHGSLQSISYNTCRSFDPRGAIVTICGFSSVLLMCVCVFRAHLHCLHGQYKAKDPVGTKNIREVSSPGVVTLRKLPSLHLTPRLPPGNQQHLLTAEACTHQTDAQPHVEHQHQEQLQA